MKPLRMTVRKAGDKLAKACWEGYEAIGMKVKDGRKAPNCVPMKDGGRS